MSNIDNFYSFFRVCSLSYAKWQCYNIKKETLESLYRGFTLNLAALSFEGEKEYTKQLKGPQFSEKKLAFVM